MPGPRIVQSLYRHPARLCLLVHPNGSPLLSKLVCYQNAENGFCVVRIKARGQRELVTLVGHAAAISAGEWITEPVPFQLGAFPGLVRRHGWIGLSADGGGSIGESSPCQRHINEHDFGARV